MRPNKQGRSRISWPKFLVKDQNVLRTCILLLWAKGANPQTHCGPEQLPSLPIINQAYSCHETLISCDKTRSHWKSVLIKKIKCFFVFCEYYILSKIFYTLNIGYRKNLHFRHFKSRKFCAKLSLFVRNFDNSIENIVNFYTQFEF